jgi:hypothetical protein
MPLVWRLARSGDNQCRDAQNEDMPDLFPPDGRHSLPDGSLEVEMTEDGYASNLVRRDDDGTLCWQLIPPEGATDAWVEMRVDGDILVATSWSGWSIRYDINSGRERGRTFTK